VGPGFCFPTNTGSESRHGHGALVSYITYMYESDDDDDKFLNEMTRHDTTLHRTTEKNVNTCNNITMLHTMWSGVKVIKRVKGTGTRLRRPNGWVDRYCIFLLHTYHTVLRERTNSGSTEAGSVGVYESVWVWVGGCVPHRAYT